LHFSRVELRKSLLIYIYAASDTAIVLVAEFYLKMRSKLADTTYEHPSVLDTIYMDRLRQLIGIRSLRPLSFHPHNVKLPSNPI
jgi:hypothetical protein